MPEPEFTDDYKRARGAAQTPIRWHPLTPDRQPVISVLATQLCNCLPPDGETMPWPCPAHRSEAEAILTILDVDERMSWWEFRRRIDEPHS